MGPLFCSLISEMLDVKTQLLYSCRKLSTRLIRAARKACIRISKMGQRMAALLETPLVSFYRISPLTYFFMHRLAAIKNFSIVNILAGERIIPELIQQDFTAQNIFEETKKILGSEEARSEMIAQFRRIKKLIEEKTAPQNAAQELEKLIKKKNID
jgi:lipid-A-disaccharide synthase